MAVETLIKQLEAEREKAAKVFSLAEAELKRIEKAIAGLRGKDEMTVDAVLHRNDYQHLTILAAAEAYLREVHRPADTSEIALALQARGVKTDSKSPKVRWIQMVYSALNGAAKRDSARIKRTRDKNWVFVGK